jgi:hypothetical protein
MLHLMAHYFRRFATDLKEKYFFFPTKKGGLSVTSPPLGFRLLFSADNKLTQGAMPPFK